MMLKKYKLFAKAGLMCLLLFFVSFADKKESDLFGHWIITAGDPYELNVGDTLKLEKKTRSDKMYEWGGVASGYEFLKDGSFNEYHNVMCSTESSPVSHYEEKWKFESNEEGKKANVQVISIYGSDRTLSYRVVSVSKKRLILIKKS
jgi:hypothetical protein